MSRRISMALGLCMTVFVAAMPAAANDSCGDEIKTLEAAVEAGSPTASRSDQEAVEIELALAQLELLCDDDDEWDVSSRENRRAKDDSIATLRQYSDDDENDED